MQETAQNKEGVRRYLKGSLIHTLSVGRGSDKSGYLFAKSSGLIYVIPQTYVNYMIALSLLLYFSTDLACLVPNGEKA
jgi:hypothetical protein